MKYLILFWVVLCLFVTDFAQARLRVDFQFKDLQGKIYTSASLKGKPIVIYVGSTLWANCGESAPYLQKAFLKYKDEGVVFLAAFYLSKRKAIEDFKEKYHPIRKKL